ncbi:SRPX2-like protein, partial [Mya arenaria]
CCDINDLEGELVSCNDEDTIMFHNGMELTKTDNFQCRVTSQGRHYQFKCVDGKWVENTALLENHSASFDALSHPRGKRGFLDALGCLMTLFSCLWNRPRPRDTNPPKLVCPDGDKIRYGEIEPFQTYRKVFWSEPTAEDDRDGTIRAIRLNGRPSGRHFKEGPTTVTYEAKDRQGNWARCDVAINAE